MSYPSISKIDRAYRLFSAENFRQLSRSANDDDATSRKDDQEYGNACILAFDNFIFTKDPGVTNSYVAYIYKSCAININGVSVPRADNGFARIYTRAFRNAMTISIFKILPRIVLSVATN